MTKEAIYKAIKGGELRHCNKCHQDIPVSEFFVKKGSNDNQYRFNSPCKKCSNIYQRNHRSDYQRNYQLLKKFGIGQTTFNEMLSKQNGLCAICGISLKLSTKNFAVDHCHKTKKIRGLLCQKCNLTLGYFNDNIDLLHKAIKYLNEH